MTESRTPLDAALDLVLYAPLGLALTITEELPKLAAKGRSTLTSRVTTARVVGQFAVTQGRREVERRFQSTSAPTPGPRPASTRATPAATSVAPEVSGAGPAGSVAPGAGNGTSPSRPAPTISPRPSGSADPRPAQPRPAQPRPAQPRPAQPRPAGQAAGTLAIPGYDSLSASQVVQRLAGLSAGELDAVKSYEAANRGRRTVLARISQLQP